MRKSVYVLIAVALVGMFAAYNYSPAAQKPAPTPSAPQNTNTTSSSPTPTPTQNQTSTFKNGTFSGSVASNRFEDIQVSITVNNDKITDVQASATSIGDSRSQNIVDTALPLLKQAALQSQSSNIDSVSGATYASNSYIESLQSAIDKAKI